MRAETCFGFVLSIFITFGALAARAETPPTAQQCVEVLELPKGNQSLFVAVVSGFFHDAPCEAGAPRVVVFRYTGPSVSGDFALDFTVDRRPKGVTGRSIYEIIGRVADHLNDRLRHPGEDQTLPVAAPQVHRAVGYLRINAQPWANIWIDGADTGLVTPIMRRQVATGRHTVTLKNPKYRCEGTYTVDVPPGDVVVLMKRLDCTE